MDFLPTHQRYEKLISLEDHSDVETSEDEVNDGWSDALANSGGQFEADINKLKHESSAKFRRRWHEIIARYSEVDDTVESDEIDLHTGKVTIDNGHLRSMAEDGQMINGVKIHGSIWAGDYDLGKIAREEDKVQRHKRKSKHKMREMLKSEDRFHTTSPFNTSDSEVLEDNLLLIGLSPSKKIETSPLKRKASMLPRGYLLSSPIKRSSSILHSSPIKSVGFNSNDNLPTKLDRARTKDSAKSDHDELFSVVSDLTDSIQVALFSCAFPNCAFSSESKSAYRSHLLSRHTPELLRIGYPVPCTSHEQDDIHIPELTILKLNLHFPLQLHIPEGPLECNKNISAGKCKRTFLNPEQLTEHHKRYPKECSTRRQILLCPLLGCAFMTDDGFEEWKAHVNTHNSASSNFKIIKPTPSGPAVDVMENVDDLFSDDVSSLDFSDDEGSEKADVES